MNPEQAEAEAIRRVGLVILMATQAVALVVVATLVPFWPAVTYGAVAGWLIAATYHDLESRRP